MRTIHVEERDSGHAWAWLAAGALVGLGVGVLVAEHRSGHKGALRKLVARGRGVASMLIENFGPLLETARGLQDVWAGDSSERDEDADADDGDDDLDEDLDDALDDEHDDDELDDGDEDDEDDENDEDDDEDDEDDEEEAADDLDEDDAALDARVLEAFSHDPILAERAIEIEDVGEGDIVLHGHVRTAPEVKHAVTMARGVPGVTRVRERLTVVRPR